MIAASYYDQANEEEKHSRYDKRRGDDDGHDALLAVRVWNSVTECVNKDEKTEKGCADDCDSDTAPLAAHDCVAPILAVTHGLKLND